MNTKAQIRPILLTLVAASALVLVSCAGGSTYAEAKSGFPPIPNGKGRVFVYRPSGFGAGVKPQVKIDNEPVGISEGNGFLYSDQSPGQHVVSTSTKWKHKTTINVSEGRRTFVKCTVYPGLFAGHIIPKQVDRTTGEAAIQTCKTRKPPKH